MLAVIVALTMTRHEFEKHCNQCGRCCSYFCVEVDAPESMSDIDDYVWILAHQDVAIHVEGDSWSLMVKSKCRYLYKKGHCKIYDRRPRICRGHEPGLCEFDSKTDHEYDDLDYVFTDIDALIAHGKKLFPRKKKKKKAKKRRSKLRKMES